MAKPTKLPSGKWRAQIRRKGLPSISHTFDTFHEAAKWQHDIESAVESGEMQREIDYALIPTVSTLLDRYLREVVPKKKGADSEKIRIGKMQEADFAKLKITEIDSTHIASYRDARLAKVTSGTVLRELQILSAFFNTAHLEWGIEVKNPVESIRKPKPNKSRDRRLSEDEMEVLFESANEAWNPEIPVILTLAIETAMRRSELLSLTWSRVNLDKSTAYIPDTKNGTARTVPLSPAAIDSIKSLKQEESDDRLFHFTPSGFKSTWQRVIGRAKRLYIKTCKQSGITPDPNFLTNFRFHDNRHEATSRLFEQHNLNVVEAASVTGHKDLRMLNRYSHLNPEGIADKMSGNSTSKHAEHSDDSSIESQLSKLKKLLESGLIPEDAYKAKVQSILDTI